MQILSNKIKKNNFLIFFLCFLLAGFFIFSFQSCNAAGEYNYTQLEPIPGSLATTGSDFVAYLQAIYKFAIWTVGIAAILMITIGGFMYLTSAGNNSKMDVAKGVITNAIIGLVVALSAYLLLYVINPDLVKINITLKPLGSGTGTSAPRTGTTTPGTGTTNPKGNINDGKCTQIDNAISNNSSGVNPATLKSIMVGGEGCDKKLSTDGYGSCGYSQALPAIRAKCGITGSANETCTKIQNDPQLDANCAAWLIKDNEKRCGSAIQNVASCYNSGKPNNCAKTTNNYCGRVSDYYNTL